MMMTTLVMGARLALAFRSTATICIMALFCFSIVSGQIDWADDDDDPGKFYCYDYCY